MSSSGKKYNMMNYEEKAIIVRRLLENALTLQEVSTEYCIGESTLRDWLNKIDYDMSNIEKLEPHRPSNLERKRPVLTELAEWIQKEIVELIKQHPGMGPLKLKHYFYRHHQIILSEKKIYFFLKSNGIIDKRMQVKRAPEKHERRFEFPYPLAAVQLDLLTVKLTNKGTIYLVTFIDDYSRYILMSQFIQTKTMTEVIRVLMRTVRLHGVMEIIICDKGSEFVSWQSFTEFEKQLCDLDIELIASGPDTPQNQGKIEKWHQSYRNECEAVIGGFDSHCQAQSETNRFVNYYNYERPHQSLGGLVPADRYYGLSQEVQQELSQYHAGNHQDKCLYFCCNINGKKIVVSGPRNGELTIYQNQSKGSHE
jgi:transposase InsO family protein